MSVNEAYRFTALIRGVPGYQTVQPGTTFELNNAVLVRDGITVTGFEARQMCDATPGTPPRSATLVTYDLAGQKRAHISTHLNSHIEAANQIPQNLPRVKQAIRHMIRLEAWVGELHAAGYRVTVAGDFNWAWSADDTHDWTYSPEAMFGRLGMALAFDDPTAPHHGTLGSRRIDYVAFYPDDLTVTGQSFVTGEHSDHAWVLVQTETIPKEN